ncbi:MAG: glycosyltransferase family 2 protein [Lachnospiraceae bacterium]|nr:glycosyltransferase family 2 protein [Lachnospiraceae bacterium]
MKKTDIIVPVFNEEEGLVVFYEETKNVIAGCEGFGFRFIFINDGSNDNTLKVVKTLAEQDPNVKYVSFSRNFGKEAAIFAGLQASTGDYTILMDSDLQHPPALIPEMLKAVEEEGYGAAGAKRKTGFFSRAFVGLNNMLSNVKLQKGATDYMCMARPFVDAILKLCETQRFSKGLFAWVGYKVKWLDYEQPERVKGSSKWNFGKLFKYATDGITSFSTVPLALVTCVGAIVCLLAFIYILITLIQTWIFGIAVPGYVTTLVVLLFMGGVIILAIGILGEYIGRIYMESKNRPLYIMEETNIEDEKKLKKEHNENIEE